ncbi:treacle protein-like [Amphibalanus amphitrite]|uniref:treacle protein-like n=1 Tax=Amphibalanus amphitrite TaxID=1232801 RepID=UPI001C9068E7|nr:treacle protein-like [Amphibalanus amphitrite]
MEGRVSHRRPSTSRRASKSGSILARILLCDEGPAKRMVYKRPPLSNPDPEWFPDEDSPRQLRPKKRPKPKKVKLKKKATAPSPLPTRVNPKRKPGPKSKTANARRDKLEEAVAERLLLEAERAAAARRRRPVAGPPSRPRSSETPADSETPSPAGSQQRQGLAEAKDEPAEDAEQEAAEAEQEAPEDANDVVEAEQAGEVEQETAEDEQESAEEAEQEAEAAMDQRQPRRENLEHLQQESDGEGPGSETFDNDPTSASEPAVNGERCQPQRTHKYTRRREQFAAAASSDSDTDDETGPGRRRAREANSSESRARGVVRTHGSAAVRKAGPRSVDHRPGGSARTVTVAEPGKVDPGQVKDGADPDEVLFGEATAGEGQLASSMMPTITKKGMRCIPRMRHLLFQSRLVHRAAAEYLELLPPPEPDQSADCVPAGSRGRRLLVLRQSRPASLADKVQDDRPAARQTVLPPASMPQALRVIHELRVQNLHLQAALLRAGIEPLRPAPETQAEPGQLPRLRPGRGSHKELAMVAATRLRHLERLEAGMERVFSTAQIGIICGEDNRAVKKWSEKDLWRAIELRTMCSRKVFDYVRGSLGVPLPCVATLHLRCKGHPELEAALERAVGAPAPRCPTCRRNRDDAATEEERRQYEPRPRPPKRRHKEDGAAARRKKARLQVARRTGRPVGSGVQVPSDGKLISWKPIEPPSPRFAGPTAHWSTVNAEDQSASDGDDQSDGEYSDERYAKYRDRVVQEPLWM